MPARAGRRPVPTAARPLGVALGGALVLVGCAVPRPPGELQPAAPRASASELGSDATGEDAGGAAADRVAGFDAVERAAVRVRNVRCGSGIATGSGFAVDAHTLITNEHVVEGAAELQVSTYDGQELEVSTAGISTIADLAVVRTEQELPAHVPLSDQDPVVGDPVSVVGFPSGGPMTTSSGQVLGMADDPLDAMAEQVVATDAPVEHGSSGSALLDATGEVVGVVYAGAVDGEQSFAVPVSVLSALLSGDAQEAPPACG